MTANNDNHQTLNLAKTRILVVEDNAIAAKLARIILEEKNCQVDWVATGRAVLQQLDRSYQLILLDLGLPDMDGFELITAIRNYNQAGLLVPIIVLTAHVDEEKTAAAKLAGANDILAKPFTSKICDWLLSGYVYSTQMLDEVTT